MGLLNTIKKRLSNTTYNTSFKANSFKMFNNRSYDNHTTWLEIYKNEPFIRGAIDAKVNASIGEWKVTTVSKNPTKAEKDLVDQINEDLSDPFVHLTTKLRTMAYRLIIDTIVYVEVSRGDMNFYILNPEMCELKWVAGDKYVEGIKWSKTKDFSDVSKYILLKDRNFAYGSMFDADTNLFKASPMETILKTANLLASVSNYNLGVFENGGTPSMLFTLPQDTSDKEFDNFVGLLKRSQPGSNIVARGDIKTIQLAGFTKDMEYDKLVTHAVQSTMTTLQVSPQMMSMGGMNSPSGGESARQEMNSFSTGVHNIQSIIDNVMTMILINLYSKGENIDNDGLLPKRGRKAIDPAKNIRFKLKKWVDKRQQSAIHKIYADIPALTPNEIRADLGKEPIEGGDELRGAPSNIGNVGVDNPMGQPERGTEQEDTEGDTNSRESDIQEAESK